MINVGHRSSTDDPSNGWTFDVEARVVNIHVMRGSVPVETVVPICSSEHPRPGAYPIMRTGEESWRILPVRYVRTWPRGVETLTSIDCAIAPELGIGRGIALTNAPSTVSAAIERAIT